MTNWIKESNLEMVCESFGANFVRVDGLLVHNLPERLHLKEPGEIVFYGWNDYELNTANISKLFIVKIHLTNQFGATTVFKFPRLLRNLNG